MRDSVPSASYSSVCNVLRQWNIPLIPTYRVYRLYDKCTGINTLHTMLGYMGIYKTLKTIETLGLHERVPKLVTVVLYIPILPSIPYNNIYSPIYIYKGCYSVEQEFPCL